MIKNIHKIELTCSEKTPIKCLVMTSVIILSVAAAIMYQSIVFLEKIVVGQRH